MQKIIILGFILAIAATCEGVWPFKDCPNIDLQQNFNISSFLGKWYEIARSRDFPYEFGDCTTATYGFNVKDLGHYTVEYKQRIPSGNSSVQGDVVLDPSNPAILHSSLGSDSTKVTNQILETDYVNYALIYACKLSWYGLEKEEYGWILTRNQTIDEPTRTRLLNKFDALGLKQNIAFTNQVDCGKNASQYIDIIKEEIA